jgi:hypothetical protein
MKFTLSFLMAAAFLTLAGTAHAQIVWLTPQSITGPSDISTLGTPFAAVGVNNFGSAIAIGDTTFNPIFSDPTTTITFGPAGGGTDGSHSTATPYSTVLDGVAYVGFSDVPVTTSVTINDLVPGNEYQVEVWNPGGRLTDLIGKNTVVLSDQLDYGIFIAGSTSESFNFGPQILGDAGELSAVAVRTIPEPSTYALALAGLVLLGYRLRRQRTLARV